MIRINQDKIKNSVRKFNRTLFFTYFLINSITFFFLSVGKDSIKDFNSLSVS